MSGRGSLGDVAEMFGRGCWREEVGALPNLLAGLQKAGKGSLVGKVREGKSESVIGEVEEGNRGGMLGS